ncbi:MAG TPA: LysR family transcriptional regulator [Syntrophales bacterium]|nr:LysR family transcriptional regulator [Syntrophales bacterium]
MELRHLIYFIAVAEELHFGRAARRLNISQPPLSQQIRQLEAEIGVRLFERTKRRVEITQPGLIFLEEARKIVRLSEEAVRRTIRAGKGEIGKLTVGYVGSANYSLLPPVVRGFRKRFPKVDLALMELNTSHQIEALQDGRIQIGFLRPPKGSERNGLSIEPLIRESLLAALPQSHALAGKRRLSWRMLSGEQFIMIPRQRAPGFYDQIINLCQQEGFSPDIVLEASQFHTIIGMVSAEIGITIVPSSMQAASIQGVVFRPVGRENIKTELAMAWQKKNPSPVLLQFIELARETAKTVRSSESLVQS